MDKNKKLVYSWVMYDLANSAFATTILAAVLPVFYSDVAGKHLTGNLATVYFGYTTTIAAIIIAFLAPILGAAADYSNSKKIFLNSFATLGIISTGLLYFVNEGQYILASAIFIFGSIGFSGANVFYDSFLPIISPRDKIDYLSTLGYAAGYLGGGILLLLNLVMIMKPSLFGIPNTLTATRLTFVTVAVWWFIFSLPAFKNLPEVRSTRQKQKITRFIKIGFSRVNSTLHEVRKYRELWKFLLAFWVYNDGIGTIIRMATIYGTEVGIGQTHLIGALLLTQFVGIPFSLLFGKLAEKIGAKKGIFLALSIYLLITIKGYFLATTFDFWLLAGMVGLVQGGAQALSRSLYGSMVPENKSAEFFGFFGLSSKFAAIVGPLVFSFVGHLTGTSRLAIIAVASFFIIGMIILSTVDVEKGRRDILGQ